MPTTPNKLYSVQTTGSNSGTWGTDLNNNTISIVDSNMAAVVTKTLSNVNVTLSATEAQASMVRLNGTMTGNVLVTSANLGFYMVENVTSGAFAVTWTNGVNTLTISQSHRYLLFADATNGLRIIANVDLSGLSAQFPSGTLTLFVQAAAPTGWTISTTYNDRALRVVSSSPSSGGSVPFSTLFARTAVDSHVLTTTEIPAHTHTFSATTGSNNVGHTHSYSGTTGTESADHQHTTANGQSFITTGSGFAQIGTGATATGTTGFTSGVTATHTHAYSGTTSDESITHVHAVSGTTGSTGSGGGHIHNIDMRLTYVDAIICSKD